MLRLELEQIYAMQCTKSCRYNGFGVMDDPGRSWMARAQNGIVLEYRSKVLKNQIDKPKYTRRPGRYVSEC